MRIFIAVPIPEDIQEYIFQLQKQIPSKGVFPNDHLHLTLQFLGDEIPEDKLADIKVAIKKTFEQSMPDKNLMFQLRTINTFKNRFGQIRVIWIGLKISKLLLDLQKELEKNLELVGFKNEKVFLPHVTLARVKIPRTTQLEEALKKIPVEEKVFEINEIHLIQSLLKPDGAKYKVLEKYMWEEEK
ncbi:MAG: 2'-5' RNA ligase, 2'-5' RNA ligase [Candidatus Peregrinibacteria bacterium GW2011_GWF2_33_10]|nr:MAG: 2'-5' RNA ligase, 2'-5' RNA ligase [Candidatus Peregrinibacteria bacterium GW2011_GWF2_33_10]OGJ44932.1 MAG: 2'-5' RNA ligase [Candidatus Peregrinibacteria bacterium RIFOXYA12_FULL_33_12]OGJ45230.1 MAG: 2'-5' RNA ligase [Candidatus Peregrinibacteria bacterium RIFOXYA2_FULL_33_21]OGJ51154.1 MAG: 2'-5' RNA ligase [Candidatus Peregrinibacteria bacterium RIFOXYB2_FULL_33_20]